MNAHDTIKALGHRLRLAPLPAEAGRVWLSGEDATLGTSVSLRERPWYAGTSLAYEAELAVLDQRGEVVRLWRGSGATMDEAADALRDALRGSMLGAAA